MSNSLNRYIFDDTMEEKEPLIAARPNTGHTLPTDGPNRYLAPVTGATGLDNGTDVAFQGSSGHHLTVSTESRLHTEHATTDMQTFMHILKGNVGTGLLGLPYAVSQSGIVLGTFGLAFMGVVALTCMHIMVDVCHDLCGRTNSVTLDYGEVADQSLKLGPFYWLRRYYRIGGYVVNSFLIFTQLGFCCVYFLFMADNIRQIYCFYYGNNVPSVQLFMLMLLPLILIYCFIRNLDDLAPFSALANLLTVVSILIIYEYLVANIDVSSSEIELFGKANGIFIFFGTAIYSYEGIGVVLPLENKMKNPQNFSRVMLSGMLIVVVLYCSMGILGYLCFRDLTEDTVTLNLPMTSLYIAVRMMLVAAIFVSYGIQLYVPIVILWPFFMERMAERYHLIGELAFRTMVVLFTMSLAMVVPHLALFIAFVGAFSSSALAIIFPPLLQELAYSSRGYGTARLRLRLARNVFFILFGLVGFVLGTYVSLEDIVKSFHEHDKDNCNKV